MPRLAPVMMMLAILHSSESNCPKEHARAAAPGQRVGAPNPRGRVRGGGLLVGLRFATVIFFHQGLLTGTLAGIGCGCGSPSITQLAQLAGERGVQLVQGAIDGDADGVGLVGHGNGLQPPGPCLDLAALVLGTGLLAVLVSDMQRDPSQLLVKTLELGLCCAAGPFHELAAVFDAVITVDLYLHGTLLVIQDSI